MKKWFVFLAGFVLLVLVSFTSYLYINRTAFASQTLERLFGVPCSVRNISWSKKGLYVYDICLSSQSEPLFSCAKVEIKLPLIEQIALATGFRPVFIDKICLSKATFHLETPISPTHTQSCSRKFFVKKVELEKTGIFVMNAQGKLKTHRPKCLQYIRLQGIDRTNALCLSELICAIGSNSLKQVKSGLESSVKALDHAIDKSA